MRIIDWSSDVCSSDLFTATMSKARRKGRIFVDWLRNQRGSTAIMPYAVRARPDAPVAAPVTWDELADIEKGSRFTLKDRDLLLERARSRAVSGWGIASQVLPDSRSEESDGGKECVRTCRSWWLRYDYKRKRSM